MEYIIITTLNLKNNINSLNYNLKKWNKII